MKLTAHYVEAADDWLSKSVREEKIKMAKSQKTPVGVLEMLAKGMELSIREALAKNPKTPPSALEILSKSAYASVKEDVAKHPNTPLSTLEMLAKDLNHNVKFAAKSALLKRKAK